MSPLWRRARDRRGWRDVEFLVLDFETTSPDSRTAEPLSVGWITVADGRVQCNAANYLLIDHRGEVPESSMRIHGLLPEHLREGHHLDDVAARLREAASGRFMVAHGAFLEGALLTRLGVPHAGAIDTMAMVRRLDDRFGQPNADARLPGAAQRHGIPPMHSHHAFADALTTALLLITLAGELEVKRGRCHVDDLVKLGRF